MLRKFNPALKFDTIRASEFDILHYHGDDYLIQKEKRRVRTFYGSAFYEALHARKINRFMYQGLFYFLEWISCLNYGIYTGISRATCKALPLVKTVVPCGVPCDTFKPGNEKTEYPSILFIGDLGSRKRGDYLVKLFNNDIIKKYPECRLTIVGPEKCEGKNIRNLSTISERELISEYQKAWIYCMPSSYEGFGVPAIEAMACGTAVVAVDNQGIREIITHNNNGLISDYANLSYSITKVLSNKNLRERLENNGRETVLQKYDIKNIAAKYEELYILLAHIE
jgi:glycosyltransferase involved in cell wall biosynthesis